MAIAKINTHHKITYIVIQNMIKAFDFVSQSKEIRFISTLILGVSFYFFGNFFFHFTGSGGPLASAGPWGAAFTRTIVHTSNITRRNIIKVKLIKLTEYHNIKTQYIKLAAMSFPYLASIVLLEYKINDCRLLYTVERDDRAQVKGM